MLVIPDTEYTEASLVFLGGVPLAISEEVVRNFARAQADFSNVADLTARKKATTLDVESFHKRAASA